MKAIPNKQVKLIVVRGKIVARRLSPRACECGRVLHSVAGRSETTWQTGAGHHRLSRVRRSDKDFKLRNRIIWQATAFCIGASLAGTRLNWWTKSLDPIRVPAKYPDKKYFPNKGKLSGNPRLQPSREDDSPVPVPGRACRAALSMTNEGDSVLDAVHGGGIVRNCADAQPLRLRMRRSPRVCGVRQLHAGRLRTRPMVEAHLRSH